MPGKHRGDMAMLRANWFRQSLMGVGKTCHGKFLRGKISFALSHLWCGRFFPKPPGCLRLALPNFDVTEF